MRCYSVMHVDYLTMSTILFRSCWVPIPSHTFSACRRFFAPQIDQIYHFIQILLGPVLNFDHMIKVCTVHSRYLAVSFLQTTHKIYPIARPSWRSTGCLLWGHSVNQNFTIHTIVLCHIFCDIRLQDIESIVYTLPVISYTGDSVPNFTSQSTDMNK